MGRKTVVSPQGGSKAFDSQGAYYKQRNKESVGQGNRHMQTFNYSRKSERMTSYSDSDYLVVKGTGVNSGGAAYFAAGCLEAFLRGMKTGNMKEIVADQQTGFVNSCDYGIEILLELGIQMMIKKLLAYAPRCDTVTSLGDGATTNVDVALYEEATLTDLLQMLKELEFPDVVWKVVKDLLFYFKVSDSWMKGETVIPPRYFIPYIPYAAAATVKGLIQTYIAEQGEMRLHCQKFGIKISKFSESWLDARELTFEHPDALAYFNHAGLNYRGGAADKTVFRTYPFQDDVSEGGKWWFYNDPNETKLNYLAKLFETYNATYNKYGGLLNLGVYTTTQDDWAVRAKYTEGTEFLATTILEQIDIWLNFNAAWCQVNTLNIELTGTDITNGDINLANSGISWPFATIRNAKYGVGLDEVASDNVLINYLIELMF